MLAILLKPITGLIVELAISWVLVWLIEKKDLRVLGLVPNSRRLRDFGIFFLTTAICCAIGFLMRMVLAHEQWQQNPALSAALVLKGTWWMLNSVLYEELIFRGVLLYILIKRIGNTKGILISSIAFGIYHWFSFNVTGNIPQMIFIFFTTGLFGWVLAYAYARTSSLYAPIAIHLGWNLTNGFIFSQGSIGNGIFIPVADQPKVTISYFTYYFITLLPMLGAMLLNYLLLRKKQISSAYLNI